MTPLDELKRLFKENILIEFTDKSLICTGQIPTKPILELIDSYEQLQRRFEVAVEVIRFYADEDGGPYAAGDYHTADGGEMALNFLRSLDNG